MANTHEIKVQRREDEGKGASRRLRHAGQVPAIVYGGELNPVSIQLNHNEVWLASQHDWFYSSILDLSLNGDIQKVLLRDMQRHPYKQLVMHLDFQRVKAGEKIHMNVPLHFVNIDESPAGKAAEVSVTSEMNDVAIVCLPKDLPEFIEVDLGNIAAGDTVKLSAVTLPKGVELAHPVTDEHDPAVAVARFVKEEVEEEAPAEEAATEEAPAANEQAGEAAAEGDAAE